MKAKKKLKNEGLWSKIRDIIRSITKNSDDYDEKYIKIKLNSDDHLSLNKTIEILSKFLPIIVVIRAVFYGNNKFYSYVFLDKCVYKI